MTRKSKIESFLIFVPFVLLSLTGVIDAKVLVYGTFAIQVVSFFVIYRNEGTIRIDYKWRNIIYIFFAIFAYLFICSFIGYSTANSLRVTLLVCTNILLLILNCLMIKDKMLIVFEGFLQWCFLFALFSILFSVIGLLIGSSFQLFSLDDGVVIYSNVRLGPFLVKQYAVKGGLINGNLGVASWFYNPNTFSVISFISFSYSLFNKKWWFLPIGLTGIILGFSRAVILMSAIVVFIFLYEKMNKAWRVIYIGMTLALFIFLLYTSIQFNVDFNGRQIMWSVLINYSLSHWFLPSGLGTSSLILKDFGRLTLSAHNLYINLLVETGFVGLIVFFVSIVKTLRIGITQYKYNKSQECLYLIILIISMSLLGITEVTFLTFSFFNYLFAYILLVTLGINRK